MWQPPLKRTDYEHASRHLRPHQSRRVQGIPAAAQGPAHGRNDRRHPADPDPHLRLRHQHGRAPHPRGRGRRCQHVLVALAGEPARSDSGGALHRASLERPRAEKAAERRPHLRRPLHPSGLRAPPAQPGPSLGATPHRRQRAGRGRGSEGAGHVAAAHPVQPTSPNRRVRSKYSRNTTPSAVQPCRSCRRSSG